MAAYTLEQCFGATASQTATDLIIKKSDLPGLTAAANNTGSALIVALLLHWMNNLTETNRLTDETNIKIAFSAAGIDIYEGQTADFLRNSIAAILYDPFQAPAVDPDTY
jgi:hypothetical protein